MTDVDYQTYAGRIRPCCVSMIWAVSCGYIRRGYLSRGVNPPCWCSWTLDIQGEGYKDVSPIAFCPFCGVLLDEGGS